MKDRINKNKYINFSGSAQQTRYPQALHEDYVKIDEKSFEQNLAYIYGLSKFIHFADTDGKQDSDWSEFLIDEAVVLAAISFTNPSSIEIRFKSDIQKAINFNSRHKKLSYIHKASREIYALIVKFDTWYSKLKYIEDFTNAEVNIRNEIANTITQKLQRPFKTFVNIYEATKSEFQLKFSIEAELPLAELSNIWNISDLDKVIKELPGINEAEKMTYLMDTLQVVFQHFYESVIYIRQKAVEYLQKTMESDHHFPEVALLLSFLDVFKHPQNQLNQLTQKYQDYYYENILKQTFKNPQDAQVYLSFKLDNLVNKVLIEKGTSFIAGSDSTGKNILFGTDYPVEINQSEVVDIKNIFLEKVFGTDENSKQDFVSNLYCNDIPCNSGILQDESLKRTTHAIFGEKQQGRGLNDRSMDFAKVGFAISSPVLFLKSGHREIDLILDFKEAGYNIFQDKLQQYANLLNNSKQEIISKTFSGAFNIELSSVDGWLEVKKYAVILDNEGSSVKIRFDISSEDPAICSCSEEMHLDNYHSDYPILKVVLNNNSYIYPYFLFSNMELEQVSVDVNVKGVKDLVVYNNVGPVNISNPFFPFGPIPSKGSYMLVGNNEVFQKQLDELTVQLDWFELPADNLGFHDYYKEYNSSINNASFEGELSILKGGSWLPEEKEEKQVFKLFRTSNNEELPLERGLLKDKVSINNIDMSELKHDFNFTDINKPLTYTSQSQRGFLKLELSNPQAAFGHTIYPNILSEITIENAKSGLLKGSKKKELPKPPYTPQLKGLSLNYKSSVSISVRDSQSVDVKILEKYGQIFHLHPFGKEMIFPSVNKLSAQIIPSYDFVGALFIGIKDLKAPQVVSILFEMLDEFTISSEEEPPKIEWKFLANNTWHIIKPESVIRDDTNGFLRTGIIMIDISDDINQNNTVLDSSLFWLSVQCLDNPEGASNLISVNSQVARATLVGNENIYNSDYLENLLPLNTIQTSYKNIKGIKTVLQPLASFNNKGSEKKNQFQTRVSERLKNGDRAINCSDYERIILEKFEKIERATCLPNMSSDNLKNAGNVLVVVSPFADKVVNAEEPRTSSELLYEIKTYLKQFTSPFVNVEVRNPSYERIRVICSVKFKDSHNRGFYMQQLNQHINDYLSGNLGGNSHGSLVGKVVYCSDITTYLRALPFVDKVAEFSIIQAAIDLTGNYVLIDTAEENNEKDSLFATKPWSVLIPSNLHQIRVIDKDNEGSAQQAGIDNLQLGNDFIINE